MRTGGTEPFYNPTIAITIEARAEFPSEPASAGSARRFVDTTLRGWQCDKLVDVATLLVSELVANAVLHAQTAIGVMLRLAGGRLRVEVSDGASGTPGRKLYSPLATTGRGLMLVERLSSGWGVTPVRSGGKAVWFELDQRAPVGDTGVGLFDLDFDLDSPEETRLAGGGVDAGWGEGGSRPSPGDNRRPQLRSPVLCLAW